MYWAKVFINLLPIPLHMPVLVVPSATSLTFSAESNFQTELPTFCYIIRGRVLLILLKVHLELVE